MTQSKYTHTQMKQNQRTTACHPKVTVSHLYRILISTVAIPFIPDLTI